MVPEPCWPTRDISSPKWGWWLKTTGFSGALAEPFLPLDPVHTTAPGAEVTIFKDGIGLFDPLSKFALSLQFLIGWDRGEFFFCFGLGSAGEEE